MQKRHSDSEQYFNEQATATRRYIYPFIDSRFPISENITVAEIGCGAGGDLLPFLEAGCTAYGIDIDANAINLAHKFYARREENSRLTLIANDIFDINPPSLPSFDLIIMRDVLEHIHNHKRFVTHLSRFLKPDGVVFMAFPPFSMPFGGHQQMCRNKIASVIPYYHLLPRRLYAGILRLFGESEGRIEGLLEIKDTRIHLWKFHRMIAESDFEILAERLYLINPNYEVKFGLKPRRLPAILNIPRVREFFITTCYELLGKK